MERCSGRPPFRISRLSRSTTRSTPFGRPTKLIVKSFPSHAACGCGSRDARRLPGWQAELEKLIREMKIKCAFDAIAGEMSGNLLTMLPPGGKVFVYGRLAPEAVGNIQPLDLIYRGKSLQAPASPASRRVARSVSGR